MEMVSIPLRKKTYIYNYLHNMFSCVRKTLFVHSYEESSPCEINYPYKTITNVFFMCKKHLYCLKVPGYSIIILVET